MMALSSPARSSLRSAIIFAFRFAALAFFWVAMGVLRSSPSGGERSGANDEGRLHPARATRRGACPAGETRLPTRGSAFAVLCPVPGRGVHRPGPVEEGRRDRMIDL